MRRIAHISLVHLFIVTILFSGLLITEKYYLAREQDNTVISIVPEEDSVLEMMTTSTTLEVSENLALLLEKFKAEDIELHGLQNLQEFKELSDKDIPVLWLKLAEIFYDRHEYSVVINKLEKLDKNQRSQFKALFMYAFSLSKIGSIDKAIEQYRLLLKLNPNAQAAMFNLALLLKKQKQYHEAIPVFLKAVDISSGAKKAKAYAGLAASYYRLKDYVQAAVFFRKSLEYRPDAASIWIQLAKSLAASNEKYEDVLDAFSKGIALNADDFKAYLQQAEYQIQNLAYTDAVKTLEKASGISDDPKVHELMAWSYLEIGSRAKARKALSRTLKHSLSPKFKKRVELLRMYLDKEYKKLVSQLQKQRKMSKDLQYLQGLSYRKMGYFKSAFKTFEKLNESRKYHWRVKTQTVRMQRSRKQYEDALKQFETLLAHNLNAAFLWFEAALTHETLSQTHAGLEKINRAIALRPKNKVYQLTRARLLRMAGRNQDAMAELDTLLRINPRYLRAMYLAGNILYELGEYEKLISVYRRVLNIHPGDYDIQYQLAKAYMLSGNSSDASSMLVKLLSEQSHNIEARFFLAQIYFNDGLFTKSTLELEQLLKLDRKHAKALALKERILKIIRVTQDAKKQALARNSN